MASKPRRVQLRSGASYTVQERISDNLFSDELSEHFSSDGDSESEISSEEEFAIGDGSRSRSEARPTTSVEKDRPTVSTATTSTTDANVASVDNRPSTSREHGTTISENESSESGDEMDIDETVFDWKKEDANPKLFDFTGNPGVNTDTGLGENSTPLECFKQFISDETFDSVVTETNPFAEQAIKDSKETEKEHSRRKKWGNILRGELKIFWALFMLTGIIGKPALHMYWSTTQAVLTPFFSSFMTRDRFQLILQFLHFNNNANQKDKGHAGYDKLFKIRPFYELLRLSHMFIPHNRISRLMKHYLDTLEARL
ncbi:putative piggyBac transposable element-derived protein 4-like [Apostichopus japonicus]|uniref:Putative piggyBac transposable element-derived protein 4-like n=1 Tax=Stichopus japonicus TaxID=307972 RepID=A0A2G8JHJ6_STIJA|nr:putative piggyBac transposable element-derived protein 4-like [Apostichopus japonicus]